MARVKRGVIARKRHKKILKLAKGYYGARSRVFRVAKQAVIKMGATDLTKGKVMVVGATGSIGAVCSRLLAQAIFNVVLVSIDPARLIELKQTILQETPGATVTIAKRANDYIGDCDLIVTATSAFGQRVIDINK
jgi:predicted amino acid dehydrogenase